MTRESHSIILPQVDLRIPLWISGVFSYFDSRSLTDKEIEYCETMDLVLVTSDSKFWYPHCNLYSEQEENFLNFRGELKHPPEPKRRNIIDEMYYINYSIRDVEYEAFIDAVIYANDCVPVLSQTSDRCLLMDSKIRFDNDPIRANMASVNFFMRS